MFGIFVATEPRTSGDVKEFITFRVLKKKVEVGLKVLVLTTPYLAPTN